MSWAPAGPERFRLREDSAPSSPAVADSALGSLATPSQGAARQASPWHPDNPLTVWVALGAITFGLMAFSTSGTVRVGKTKLSGSLGVGST